MLEIWKEQYKSVREKVSICSWILTLDHVPISMGLDTRNQSFVLLYARSGNKSSSLSVYQRGKRWTGNFGSGFFTKQTGEKSYVTIDELFKRFGAELYYIDNVFLAFQTGLNGSLWLYERLIKIAMEQDEEKYWVRVIREGERYEDDFYSTYNNRKKKPVSLKKTEEEWIEKKQSLKIVHMVWNLY